MYSSTFPFFNLPLMLKGIWSVLGLLVNGYNIVGSFRNPQYTTKKKVAEGLFHGGMALRNGRNLLSSPESLTELRFADFLSMGATLFGGVFEFRVRHDFGMEWRMALRTVLAHWMPPLEGLKRFMIDCIDKGPMHVLEEHAPMVDALIESYAKSEDGRHKDVIRRQLFKNALMCPQAIGFTKMKLWENDSPYEAHIFRITLKRGSLEYRASYQDQGPCLYRPGIYADYVVGKVPRLLIEEFCGTYVETHTLNRSLKRAQEDIQSGRKKSSSVEIIYYKEAIQPPNQDQDQE